MPPITNLPLELFIEICTLLPPSDLFVLSKVCRKFYSHLCAPSSPTTQQIWKESHLRFTPKENIPQPKGMTTTKYVELLMMERGCQICKRVMRCKIYWEFEVRCCKGCFLKKTVTEIDNYPKELLNIMPYVFYNHEKYYWIEQIDFEYFKSYGLSEEYSPILVRW
ncbi:hypothetical protein RclHR1_04460010 [Rhizophagus clarus]|uniref:F-box domain-containing protein n=1 Tax=Rhizophagus clarus TaxID=94130 RepID=A0A2Z6RZ04_9GLOM|nr:hypothetical protein RclHR1_04460010 [Rhizophagus clarus]GES92445.1 hypothetical protein GLOIN_2v1837893 [Rhizophagus clarus]